MEPITRWRKSRRSNDQASACVEVASVSTWRKSRHSDNLGGNCVELASIPPWRKSSHSDEQGGECVELATAVDAVAVRDSKDPHGPHLLLSLATFRALTIDLKRQ
ncbi:DUF397 domain-containing protein [Spirillospora sp. CA-253888]